MELIANFVLNFTEMLSPIVREAITTDPNNGTGSDDQRALREGTENSRGSEVSVSQSAVTEPDHPVSVPQRIDNNSRIAQEPSGEDRPRDPLEMLFLHEGIV